MSDVLLARAAQWGGVLSSADAAVVGVDRNGLRSLLKAGSVVKVAPRAYVLASALERVTTPEARHRLSTLAILRSFGERVAASHHSALALHGLPFWRVDPEVFHVSRITGRSGRKRGTLHIHESVGRTNLVVFRQSGAVATSPTLAVIGTAMADGVEAGIVAMDAASHRGLTSADLLESTLTAMTHVPDISRARQAFSLVDPSSESVGETRTRLILQAMPGSPRVVPQQVIHDRSGREVARVDFLVGTHVVVEFDGRMKYGMSGNRAEEDLWREKRREDALRELGYVVIRLVWSDLDRPDQVTQRVLAALRQTEGRTTLAGVRG
ncbi:very-short-patch-repair endonuclease [Phycicoccus badiiscoriae]|uniref:Very-short-patch-repair endonuclease n=1 Tax=Pedococcus badiiscoriae TaxID=642776 RepID=A0A852WA31_9MICO|nr:hypothetical protein [Pedococcus badiiscoriae]NYG06087.1 very-short-patch-repair endonuclease [Pedococcus badiiscoriae]